MSSPLIITIILGGAAILIFVIVSGSKNLKKNASEKTEIIKHLNGRINLSEIEAELKKMPFSKWDKYVDDIKVKFELIDGLAEIKENVKNYDEMISQLEDLPLHSVKSNVSHIREQVKDAENEERRQDELKLKYGEELAEKLLNGDYFIGMTEAQLIDSKGNPTKIEQEVMKTKTKSIYIYGNKSSGDVFTFVNGELERFMDR